MGGRAESKHNIIGVLANYSVASAPLISDHDLQIKI